MPGFAWRRDFGTVPKCFERRVSPEQGLWYLALMCRHRENGIYMTFTVPNLAWYYHLSQWRLRSWFRGAGYRHPAWRITPGKTSRASLLELSPWIEDRARWTLEMRALEQDYGYVDGRGVLFKG